ncbi:hypothetical protein HDF14_001601 [Edaphobacter lichenicola]|uniref:Uncharacterized protein n=1 Tax=Tunturiibacter gelidiferens TaxID=3069689 RepID=A0A9X0QCY5_9BACT|nr:hypothetical protein [Edaphobacter lichenicola]
MRRAIVASSFGQRFHANALDCEGKIVGITRGNVEQFRKDWECDRAPTFAGASAHQGAEDHGQRDRLALSKSLIGEKIGDHPRMSSSTPKPSATNRVVLDQKIPNRSALRFNLTIALLVWTIWLALGGGLAIHRLFADWEASPLLVRQYIARSSRV